MSGFELNDGYGIFAPSKTPSALVVRLNHDIAQALAQPDVRDFFRGAREHVSRRI
jgi:tripartite-type tricarboxylate transporter receptor subunit TctC